MDITTPNGQPISEEQALKVTAIFEPMLEMPSELLGLIVKPIAEKALYRGEGLSNEEALAQAAYAARLEKTNAELRAELERRVIEEEMDAILRALGWKTSSGEPRKSDDGDGDGGAYGLAVEDEETHPFVGVISEEELYRSLGFYPLR